MSPDVDDLACGTACGAVDHRDITYKQFPTVATTRGVNTPPLSGNYNFPTVSQTQEEYDNISVFEQSDNNDGSFTSVKEGPGYDFIVIHLYGVFKLH